MPRPFSLGERCDSVVGERRNRPQRIQAIAAPACLLVLIALAAGWLQTAQAAGTPDISLAKVAPARVLFGSPSTVTLTASAPAGQPYGYNLTFRDVLPAGISYVGGSASIAPTVLADKPAAGQTTLIWSNVSDLAPSSSRSLTYQVVATTAGAGALRVGDSYTNNAGAYIEGTGGERDLPEFDASGQPVPGTYTGSATASATSELIPLKIVKTEPSPEGELLRGVHQNQTTYTLTVSNNLVNATNTVVVDDYLPAGLEFLGCAAVDNTTTGPEYPGAGSLVGTPPGGACPAPSLVDTVLNPAGYPAGVYTHVRWTLGSLAPGAITTINYRAGIPIHANTMTFAGGTPSAASLGQASNLDNNTGPEAQDEQSLTNYSSATGAYQGAVNPAPLLPLAAVDQITRSAEDMRILKSVTPDSVAHGQLSTWSLDLATSEYRGANGLLVTDTLPNGLCPIGAINYTHVPQDASDAECDPQSGVMPTLPYASAPIENADGTWTVTFAPTALAQNGHAVISFPTVTRISYQSGYADSTTVLSNDNWPNTVHLDGSTTAVAGITPTGAYPAGTPVIDDSSASQHASLPSISKQVATRASIVAGACPATGGSYVSGPAGAAYRAGDLVCWRVTLPFSSADDTSITQITDFLPAGYAFVPGSESAGPTNSLPPGSSLTGAANGSTISWTDVGTPIPGSNPPTTLIPRHSPAYVFDIVFKTRITDPNAHTDGDITSNLVKTSSTNTGGVSDPIRAMADASTEAPILSLVKGVKQIAAGPVNGAGIDGGVARPGDAVIFRVDLTNDGSLPAENTGTWDVLPIGTFCASVSAMTTAGGSANCTNDLTGPYTGRAVIRWSGQTVPANGSLELDYTVTIPADVYAPGESLVNDAGVVSYETPTNDPVNPTFTYVPAGNIDPSQTPNAEAARDISDVTVTGVVHSKARGTSITEGTTNTPATATIGELVNYTVSETIPAGTTVHGAVLDDSFGNGVPARQTLVGTPVMTLDGGAATGFTLNSTATTLHVDFPATFTAGVTNRVLVVTYSTRVTDVAANVRGTTVGNTATLAYTDSTGAADSVSDSTSTTIVEPNLTIAKSHAPAATRFGGGDTVTYTLLVRNPTAPGNVSPAHEISVQDVVPAGLTPTPGTLTGGDTRSLIGQTLSWTIGTLAPGATATLTYAVTVDNPVESNRTFTNQAGAITSSIAASDANERSATDPTGSTGPTGYHASTSDSVQTLNAAIDKSVLPTTGTVGDVFTYTIQTTVPAGVGLTAAHIDDVPPAGIVYDSTTSTSCVQVGGGACSPDITVGTSTVNAGTRSWALSGAETESSTGRVITIVYSAHMTAGTIGQVKTNTGSIKWTSNGVGQTVSDTAAVTVTEPTVLLNKHVSCDGAVPNVDATAGETDACNVTAGQSLTYSIVVRNTGTSAAHDITITDTKAAHLVNIGAISNGGSLVGNTITWTLAGPLAPGAPVTLTYTGQVAPAATPLTQGETIANTAIVGDYYGQSTAYRSANPTFTFTHYTPAPVTGSTRDIVTLTVQLPHLTVTKTHAGSFTRGTTDAYAITVGNSGTTATTGTVTVDDTLPAGLELNGTPSGTGWACVPSSTTAFSCSTAGTAAAAGAFPVITVPVTVLTTAPSSVTNTATANGGGDPSAPATGNNVSPVIWNYDLALQKNVDEAIAQPGDTLIYTVTVTNNGPGTSEAGAVTDTVPAGLTLVSAPGCTGTTALTCAVPALLNGGTRTFTITATINAGVATGTTITNTATVTTPNDSNPGNNSDSDSTGVHDPLLTVVKTHPGAFARGTSDHYDITVSNASTFVPTQGSVTVTDSVPAGLTPTAAAGTGWSCTVVAQLVTCTRSDSLAPVTAWPLIRVDVDVLDSAPASLVNDAVASGGNDPTPATGSDTSPVVWSADLGITKTADRAAQLPGGAVTYTLTVTNHGPGTSDTAAVTDVIPADLTFVSVSPASDCAESAGTVSCDFGHIAVGGTRIVTIAVTLDAGLPPQLVITNGATVSTPTGDTNPANDAAGTDVAVGDYADIQIVKSGPASAAPGGQIHYTLVATNNGPTTTALNTVVRDSLPSGLVLDRSSVAIDGTAIVLEAAAPATGECSATAVLTCALGGLGVGATRTITFTMTVPPAPADAAASYENLATVTSDTPQLPQDMANDVSAWTTTVPYADVSISKTASSSTVNPGGAVAYTLSATNHGPATANGVTIDDVLPSGLVPTGTSVTPAASGTCAIVAQAVHCNLGDRPAGDVTTVIVSASVDPQLTPQSLVNTAIIAAANNFDPSNDSASATIAVTNKPATDVRIEKTLATSDLAVGSPAIYRLKISNRGPADAENVVARDALPSALDFRSVTAPRGVACSKGRVVSCRVAMLPAGASVMISVTTVATRTGMLLNTATVTSKTADMKPANNTFGVAGRFSAKRTKLALTKTTPTRIARPGGRVRYTLTLRNAGSGAALKAMLCDVIPAHTTVVSAAGAVFRNGSACWSIPSLAARAAKRVTLVLRIDDGTRPGRIVNSARATASNAAAKVARAAIRVRRTTTPTTSIAGVTG